jgi:hypothetical protein
MTQRLGRLLLFLLLVADWAGDPHFGHSPFSRPMSSQEVYCHSLPCAQAACPSTLPSRDAGHAAPASIDRPSSSALPRLRLESPCAAASCPKRSPIRC